MLTLEYSVQYRIMISLVFLASAYYTQTNEIEQWCYDRSKRVLPKLPLQKTSNDENLLVPVSINEGYDQEMIEDHSCF